MKLTRSLTTLSLVFILFFTTSGGPFTTETLVSRVGPGLALLMLVLVPVLYSLPESLIVAELASMLPTEGGYYRWVGRAFGPFWAFQNGWLTWMYSLVDMALYPKLFITYLAYFAPHVGSGWIGLAVIWGATAVNLAGAGRVGRASVAAGIFVVGAFVALSLAAGLHASHLPWDGSVNPAGGAASGFAVGLSIALWNYIGWDNASTVQGEVRNASQSYPRALAYALPLVIAGNVVPLLAALAATDWRQWREGGWPSIGEWVGGGGSWWLVLGAWIAAAGMVSALALFNALLLAYSRVPFVMAVDGLLPRTLAATDRRGTPRNAVLFAAVCYSAFILLPFGGLVVADALLYSSALVLELAALVQLRRREPALRGTFRIPLGTRGVAVLAAMPVLVLLLVIGLSFVDGEFGLPALGGAALAAGLGPLCYEWVRRRRRAAGELPDHGAPSDRATEPPFIT